MRIIKCTQCGIEYKKWPYEIKKLQIPFICKRCRDPGKETIICKFCEKEFTSNKFEKRKFCSSSCSASYSNTHRKFSDNEKNKIRKKISLSMKKYHGNQTKKEHSTYINKRKQKTYNKPKINRRKCKINYAACKIHYATCKKCGKLFIKAHAKKNMERLTCSRECAIYLSVGNRTYQNGSRKPVCYFNITENKDVLLESSWEVKVAEKLDQLKIKWIRPKPLKWVDNNKTRYYFPDFYLPDYNLYLDPKNPYCMDKDIKKMKYFEDKINIVYGDIYKVLEIINNLNNFPRVGELVNPPDC